MIEPGLSNELFDAFVRIYEDQQPGIRTAVSRAEFARWHFTPVYLGDGIAALIGTLGSEIHIGVAPVYRRHWFPFKAFRRRVTELVDAYGQATTIDVKQGGTSHAFIRRLGFRVDAEDDLVVRYVLRGPYVRIDPAGRRRRAAATPSA